MPRHPMRDVVVLLPGITGSVLQRNGKDVWAVSPGAIFGAIRSLGKSLEDIQIGGKDDPDTDDLGDGIVATRLMPDIHLIPGLWSIDGYGKIRETIFHWFDVVDRQNYFEFPYDWRRPNQVAARQLAKESEAWLTRWKQRSGNEEARLVLVAHSMGGLVSRWFLEHLDGWERTRALITFGTPYRGSVNAIDSLVHGMKKKVGPFTALDLTPALRSFDSIYQLLPIYRCVDLGNGQLVRVAETDRLPGIDQPRARAALDFHDAIRAAVTDHQEEPDFATNGYRIHPITGISQPTKQSVRLEGDEVVTATSYKGKDYSGDGTVPRVSAVPVEITDGRTGMFTGEKHGSIQNDASVLMHLRGLLTGQLINFNDFERIGDTDPVTLGVEVEEFHSADQPIAVAAIAEADGLTITVSAMNADTGETTPPIALRRVADNRYETELRPLPAGAYRLTVTMQGTRESVTEIVAVF